jgi:fatty acid desaturase/predicted heme/steroid binding protein
MPRVFPPASRTKDGNKYTWDEVKTHNSIDDCWIVMHGKVYDVTSWAPRHPGGNILISGAGRDSTAFIYSYHPRYVLEILDQYCIGEVEQYDNYYKWDSKFYSTMKARVEKHLKDNNLTRDSWFMYIQTVFILALWMISYYFAMVNGSLVSTILFGFLHSQLGINIMHDGNHGAFSTSPFLCSAAAFIMDFMGSSSVVWLHQHNVGHHPNSNNTDETRQPETKLDPLAYDPDASAGFPFVRLNPSQPHKAYMRYQHLYIWILICFMNFKWFMNDIKSMRRRRYSLIDFHRITDRDMFVLYFTKALFLLYSLGVPVYSLGLAKGFLHFVVFMVVCGYAFVLMFSVNHLTEDTAFPDDGLPVESRDWAALQVMTSSNFANDSFFWTLVSGGLNFQIEHHLFPGINHVHLRGISPIVKQTCKEFGVPYHSFPTFSTAVYSYYAHLKNLGNPKAA